MRAAHDEGASSVQFQTVEVRVTKPTMNEICQMIGQPTFGARRPVPYRPVRLVFRIDDGLHSFNIFELGRVGIAKDVGRFHVVAPSGKTEVYYYDELIEAGFLDELDSPQTQSARA